MKTKFLILLWFGLNLLVLSSSAQTDSRRNLVSSATSSGAQPATNIAILPTTMPPSPPFVIEAPTPPGPPTPAAPVTPREAEAPPDLALPPVPAEIEAVKSEAVYGAYAGAPMLEVIEQIAKDANIKYQFDPSITATFGPDGKPTGLPAVTIRLQDVTPREALVSVLSQYNYALVLDPKTNIALIKPMEVDEITFPLNYRDENLYDAIDELARKAKKNYLFDPKIIGLSSEGKPVIITTNATNGLRVSLTWTNVTAPMALQALLNCYDLAMIYDPKIQIARITTKDPAAPEPMITKVIQLQYSHPTNITAILKGAFPTNRSQVLPDLRTSQLVVLATDKDMEAINDLVKQLDTPTRQVLIEATLLETSQSPQSIRGIDWSGTLEGQRISAGNGLTAGSTIMQTPGTPTTVTLPSGRTVTVTPSSSSQSSLITTFGGTSGGTGGAGAGGGTGGGAGGVSGPGGLSLNTARGFSPNIAFLNADGVSAVLSLLNRDSDTEVVATPRVVLLDNETAKLEVTRAYPIFQVTPGSANTPAASQTTYTNMGTILTVSPRISGSNYIALKVTPEVSNIDGKDSQTINGQVNMANVYATRKIDTHVLIPSGNTLVMGGLISDNRTKSYTKVPILGDLPAVGLLFRQDTKKWAKQNLIIFITPTIVQDTDFQTRPASDFLKTPPREVSDKPVSALDSGKPVDWKKPWRAQR